jgi:hypothetical protein
MLDGVARLYNDDAFQSAIHRLLGAALTGTERQEEPAAYVTTQTKSAGVEQRESRTT